MRPLTEQTDAKIAARLAELREQLAALRSRIQEAVQARTREKTWNPGYDPELSALEQLRRDLMAQIDMLGPGCYIAGQLDDLPFDCRYNLEDAENEPTD